MRFDFTVPALAVVLAGGAWSQGTLADYERGQALQIKARGLVTGVPGASTWIGKSDRFWYPRTVKGGTEFVLVDAAAGTKGPAFDHDKLAAAISSATGVHYTALKLPFAPTPPGRVGARAAPVLPSSPLTFTEDARSLEFGNAGFSWKCTLTDYVCTKGEAIPQHGSASGARASSPEPAPYEEGGDPVDGLEYQKVFPQDGGTNAAGAGGAQPGCGPKPAARTAVCVSLDGKWEALIQNYNVFLRATGSHEPATPLSLDGSEGNYYSLRSVAWSPDSRKIVAYHTRPGYERQVHYIESSPADQIQPKHSSILYRKPGDALDIAYPALFDVASRKEIELDRALFPNAFNLTPPVWWKDSRGFTFEYNQRGHQVYRVMEVDAITGKTRALIDEQSKTFFYYNLLGPGLSAGRRYRHDVNDGKEIIWASERDGWEQLYLYDGATGKVKNQITRGEWVVRNVDWVDEAKRQVWFEAGGMTAGEDPYFTHYYRINFDGTGLTRLTDADGNHSVTFSAGRKFYVDTWSRVDLPPVAQLRRSEDRKIVMDLDQGDATELLAAGVRFPEVFVAKGRDGKTDIWGTIVRPMNFDPSRKYPVIEQIYAGPQGSFVPKTFSDISSTQALAELGFIVVQIDGMGTSNRSKAFHDVCWKNLGDAGFPDRILWHQAAAAKYPYYDISRVGIYRHVRGRAKFAGRCVVLSGDFYKVVRRR